MQRFLFVTLIILLMPALGFTESRIDINTASLQELDQIVGVGPAIGQKIIDARPFSSLDDLLRVKGIGDKTLQKIKDQGLAYVMDNNQETRNNNQTNSNTQISNAQTAAIVYPTGIIINEILPSPEGDDAVNEWIELYNTNNVAVDLSGWQIKDTIGTTTTYTLPPNTALAGYSYFVLRRPATHITLNNDEDGIIFLSPDGKMADSVSYQQAKTNQSYAKTKSGWIWSGQPTPGNENIVKTSQSGLSKKQKTDNTINVAKASVVDSPLAKELDSPGQANPWLLFLTALVIAIASTTAILFLKLKLTKK